MGARPSRALEQAEATSQQFQEGVQQMKEKTYGRVTGRGDYGAEKYKIYRLPVKTPELQEEDYLFFTANTGKSRDEVKSIFQKYSLLQADAKLDRANFVNLYSELSTESGDQVNEIADQTFNAFDTDSSGYLLFNEFLVTYALTSKGDIRRKLDYSFDLYDSNSSGFLETDEVKNVINGICNLLGGEKRSMNVEQVTDKAVRDIHFNENNKVTREDFINGLMKNEDIRNLIQSYNTGYLTSTTTSSSYKSTSSEETFPLV